MNILTPEETIVIQFLYHYGWYRHEVVNILGIKKELLARIETGALRKIRKFAAIDRTYQPDY